jgi:ParB family chromosome partitioning protein
MTATKKALQEVPHSLEEIPLSKLVPSDINMRQAPPDPAADKQLKASLKAFGPLQNLIVHPQGKKYGVAGGGRRLRMLQELAADEEIPKSTKVWCKIVSEDDALAATISENYHRHDPHPLDECRAFSRLAQREGMTNKQIADEFGVSQKYVRQRLALANLHPDIQTAFVAGKIGIGVAAAYTTGSPEKQIEVYKKLNSWERSSERVIRNHLAESEINKNDWRVQLVTLKAYKAAGGEVSNDLFDNDIRILDRELLDNLVAAHVEELVEAIKAEGWSWVEVNYEYISLNIDHVFLDGELPKALQDEKAKLEARLEELQKMDIDEDTDEGSELLDELYTLENKLDDFDVDHAGQVGFSEESKKVGGVVVFVSGGIDVYRGLQKREPIGASDTSPATPDAPEPKLPREKYSQALRDDIGYHRRSATRLELFLSHPDLLTDLAEFTIVDKSFSSAALFDHILAIDLPRDYRGDLSNKHQDEPAELHIRSELEKLDFSWRKGSVVERFQAYRALSDLSKEFLYRMALAQALRIGIRGENKLADAIVDEMNIDFSRHWTPTADNFFSRVSKDVMNEALQDIYPEDDFPEETKKMNKKQLAAFCGNEWEVEIDEEPTWLPEGF